MLYMQRKQILINCSPKYTGTRKIINYLSSLQQYLNEDTEAKHFYYPKHVKTYISLQV